jgi:hypothetical protein
MAPHATACNSPSLATYNRTELQSTHSDDWRRPEALLAGEKQLLELIATGSPLRQVLERLCLFVEEAADTFVQ